MPAPDDTDNTAVWDTFACTENKATFLFRSSAHSLESAP